MFSIESLIQLKDRRTVEILSLIKEFKCSVTGSAHEDSRLSYDRFIIPIQEPTMTQEGHGILVKIFQPKVCHRHLLWHLIFKNISALEWFILFQKFNSQIKRGQVGENGLYLTLLLTLSSSTRERFGTWGSKTKSIFRFLQSIEPQIEVEILGSENLLEHLIDKLKIPKRGLPISNLYKAEKIILPRTVVSPELYVGVGYKDKGSMSSTERIDLPWVDPSNDGTSLFFEGKFLRKVRSAIRLEWKIP